MSWTPGPWKVEEYNDGDARPTLLVQRVVPGERIAPWIATVATVADARLIAAAPEMAELLDRFCWDAVEHYGPDFSGDNELRVTTLKARALLARIRGEDQRPEGVA